GGTQSGSGTTVITDTLNITGDSRRDLNTRNLETNGTTLWTGTGRLHLSNAASWTNRGTVDLQSDADWVDWLGAIANFNNQGTLIKSVGSNEDASEIGAAFNNTGTVEVQQGNLSLLRDYTQTAGVTRLNGGAIATTRVLDIQGGELAGFGTITGDVTNAAQLNPGTSTGILNITGDYTQTTTGVLNIEVGGIETGSGFDQLNITGTADLEGTLNLSQVNQFAPQLGQQFQVLTYDEADSGFTNINGLELSNGLFFTPTATEEGLALEVVDELINLGALRGGSTETVTDSVGNTDPFDYYRFNVTRNYNVELKLSGLTANADIRLLDSLGRTIAEGINPGTADELILSYLDTGIYFLQVDQAGVGENTNYQLELVTDGIPEEIVNTPPTLETLLVDQTATEDAQFNLDVSSNFNDVDAGDSLTYSATSLPDSLTINSETGVISGTPTNSNVGTTEITVTATDTEGESISDTFDLTVENVNDAPTLLTEVSDQNATENTEFNLDISGNFNDVDAGDSLTYSATGLPDNLTINSETGAISGTPSNSGIGTTEITVTATDIAGESVSDTFDLTVAGNPEPEIPDNREPEIADNAMVGTANSDTIFGTASDDIIYGLGGNDQIFASEGNNVIFGGTGNDRIYGGSQSDIIEGEEGNDIIFAGDGNNIVFGGTGNDIIYSGSGDDIIDGGVGNDIINLGGGQDIIFLAAGEGMDTIRNFGVGRTSIGLAGGLFYEDLTITQFDGGTLISAGNEILASLSLVQAININAGSFVTM
ncbi:MAG: putative Ig domain-containing protein, partial [Coleofasciculaceae cyanobacterium]